MKITILTKPLFLFTFIFNSLFLPALAVDNITTYKINVPQTKEKTKKNNVKIVYLSDENCSGCSAPVTKQGVNWHKWSHDVIHYAINSILSEISTNVPDGTVYDFSFTVNTQKQISKLNIVNRLEDDSIKVVTNPNISKNLLVLKKSVENLNGNTILTYPKNSIRTYTEIYVSVVIVQNTLFINVASAVDRDTRYKEGI